MTAAPQPIPTTSTPSSPPPPPAATVQDESPGDLQDLQAQEQQFRALLRQAVPAQGQQQQPPTQGLAGGGPPDDEDPAVKLLHSLIGGNLPDNGSAGDNGNGGGGGSGAGATQADLLSALGVPPILAEMAGAATRTPTAQETKEATWWKTVHVVFAVLMGVYVLGLIGRGIATYGNPPPPPATARNPFLLFTTGELVLSSARLLLSQRAGSRSGLLGRVSQCTTVLGEIVRDGSLVMFVLGIGSLLLLDPSQ